MSMVMFSISVGGSRLECSLVPWDTEVFEFPVAQITRIVVNDEVEFLSIKSAFETWLNDNHVRLVSCRLLGNKVKEIFWLEAFGFKFVELVLHPYTHDLVSIDDIVLLDVLDADDSDIQVIKDIALDSFGYERFHSDPRLSTDKANLRYSNWVESSFTSSSQNLLKLVECDQIVGFFIFETLQGAEVYWHLTAISPRNQGRGLGQRGWKSVIEYHRQNGASKVSTTIAAMNVPVLNLYSKLNFKFSTPEATFHLLRSI